MGRWQREALTEVLWREVAAPPPSPAATVPLPIASRPGGWDGRYQTLPVVNPPSNQKHHRGGKKYSNTLANTQNGRARDGEREWKMVLIAVGEGCFKKQQQIH